ncbi:zinc finger protein 891-like [Wyeomyia smithii]|uniref:zinc finger protein 891-like n=1 Tax=Wyeomyia smithii TaxID=174621 RepID=UPI002467FF80|nr:zinc finger protein 891-like [Wyeomyia smithii]
MSSSSLMPICCRCCLIEESNMQSVLEDLEEFGSKIYDLISGCSGVAITEDDSYPKAICTNCLSELCIAVRFQKRCLETENILQNITVVVNKPHGTTISDLDTNDYNDTGLNSVHEADYSETDKNSRPSCSENVTDTYIRKLPQETIGKTNEGVMPMRGDRIIKKISQFRRIAKTNKKHSCSICDKTFENRFNLGIHMRTHTGPRPYKCEICGKRYTIASKLQGHMRFHTGERPFKCDVCAKAFAHKSHLKAHKQLHADKRTFKCDICEKDFLTANYLSKHRHIHVNDSIYKCDICDKEFHVFSYLNAHKRRHVISARRNMQQMSTENTTGDFDDSEESAS